ncbi:MAG: response regulator [Gammaproteobacteria bacterium]|nr:response regulator [Gammaproteobacteria bacterium]MBU1775945.1 response regulator [Gammaproteobacteria bacterium]
MGIFDQISALLRQEPEQLSDLPRSIARERRGKERVNAREGTRVLIIDDSKTVVMAIKKYLRSVGYETVEAFDAETGLSMIHEHSPDLIFLDIMLPGMNGFAALRTIRRDPQARHIPVIMMSGNEQAVEQFYGLRIGADDFMKKPFSREELFFRIERLLDNELVPRRVEFVPDTVPESSVASPA